MDRNPNAQRGRIAALVLVLALACGVYLIGQSMIRHNAVQACLDSGRRDCDARLETP